MWQHVNYILENKSKTLLNNTIKIRTAFERSLSFFIRFKETYYHFEVGARTTKVERNGWVKENRQQETRIHQSITEKALVKWKAEQGENYEADCIKRVKYVKNNYKKI